MKGRCTICSNSLASLSSTLFYFTAAYYFFSIRHLAYWNLIIFLNSGPCIEKLPTSRLPANISLSTTTVTPDHDVSSIQLWLPVALIAFFKFFLATLALICCLIKRKKAKAGSDYRYCSLLWKVMWSVCRMKKARK